MGGHEMARDGQAEARSGRVGTLRELVEDVWQEIGIDARAGVR